MDRIKIAQRELRSLKSDVLSMGCAPRQVAALANIQFALVHIQCAELQLCGLPVPRDLRKLMEKAEEVLP
jgi:hypothetical protein